MNAKIGDMLLTLRIFFIGGAIGIMAGHLSRAQIPAITALALVFTGADASIKKTCRSDD